MVLSISKAASIDLALSQSTSMFSTITKASGRSLVVLARHARNRRLADAYQQWAFCSLTVSPGARAYYDALRARGKTHRQALRQLGNR